MEEELKKLREQIDAVDDKIVALLADRMELAREVGKVKKAHNADPVNMKRFNEVLNSKKQKGKELGLSETYIEDIYNTIHEHSLDEERKQ